MSEIIFVSAPKVDIYRNHEPGDTPSYEFNILFPVSFKNMRFMVKLSNGKELVFRSYGCLSQATGDRVLLRDTNFIDDVIFPKLDSGSRIELKIYDGNSTLRARLSYIAVLDNNSENRISYMVDRQLKNMNGIDIDEGIIKSINESDILIFQNDVIID